MANSTWLEATNEVLALSSLPRIPSADAFNDETGDSLQKYQATTKQFVKLANMHLGVRARNHFATERFSFSTTVNTAIYELDTGLSPENIKFESFFNVTVGDNAAQNGEVFWLDYRRFMRLYPDLSKISTGLPLQWVLLPLESDEDDPVDRIRLVPNPDAQYTLEYQAKLNAPALVDSDSKILFPPHYEHALWQFAWELLETDLGEGKEGRLGQMAREAANSVFLAAGRPPDARKAPRSMKLPSRRYRGNWIRSPLSVDAQGNLLE